MPGNLSRAQQIQSAHRAMEAEAAETALRNKELAAKRQVKDQVVDKVSGDVYVKNRFSLSDSVDFTKAVNVANILSQIGILNSPGVKLGLELMFVPVKESYGHEYIVPRTYGAIRDVTPANINTGRLLVYVESPMNKEKPGGRLLDMSPERFNTSSPADRNSILTYQVSESFRATTGDFIRWFLNSATLLVVANTRWTMEVVALEKQL